MQTTSYNESIFTNYCVAKNSELQRDMLQLLSEANEVCYRLRISPDYPFEEQRTRNDERLFLDAIEMLTCSNGDGAEVNSEKITHALQRAYEVQLGDATERDRAYYYVAYGSTGFSGCSLHQN